MQAATYDTLKYKKLLVPIVLNEKNRILSHMENEYILFAVLQAGVRGMHGNPANYYHSFMGPCT